MKTIVKVTMIVFTIVFIGSSLSVAEEFKKGPWGGIGGDRQYEITDSSSSISKIRVWAGKYIDAIQVVYKNGNISPKYGGSGGKLKEYKLSDGDYITKISGNFGIYIDRLELTTNKGIFYYWGGAGGDNSFNYTVSQGYRINGFFGRSGIYIDSIGVSVASK